jgi:hypothetical protein
VAKSFRKIARQLVGKAYQREQEKALESLRSEFDRWKSGEIDCWDLTDLIHRFHNGESRDLYKIYERGDTQIALARAIALDIIDAEEVPADLLESMRPTIDCCRGELVEDDQDPDQETK